MNVLRLDRVLAAVLVVASIAGCAGSHTSSVAPVVAQHGGSSLTPKDTSTASASPQPSAPGSYVQSTGTPAYPTSISSDPIRSDSQTGIVSQTDSTGTYTNFYDTDGNFVHQVDIGQQSASGMPIIRDTQAGGSVGSMEMPNLDTQASSGSFTVGDFSYTLDGVGTAQASLNGRSVTVAIDDGMKTGTMTSPDGSSFALDLAPAASTASTLSAHLRKVNGSHAGTAAHARHASASEACVRARWLLALAVAALALVTAGAILICHNAVTPMQIWYCYRALASVAIAVGVVAVAVSNWRKACATPTPSPTPTPPTPTPTPTPVPVASTPTPTPTDSGSPSPAPVSPAPATYSPSAAPA